MIIDGMIGAMIGAMIDEIIGAMIDEIIDAMIDKIIDEIIGAMIEQIIDGIIDGMSQGMIKELSRMIERVLLVKGVALRFQVCRRPTCASSALTIMIMIMCPSQMGVPMLMIAPARLLLLKIIEIEIEIKKRCHHGSARGVLRIRTSRIITIGHQMLVLMRSQRSLLTSSGKLGAILPLRGLQHLT